MSRRPRLMPTPGAFTPPPPESGLPMEPSIDVTTMQRMVTSRVAHAQQMVDQATKMTRSIVPGIPPVTDIPLNAWSLPPPEITEAYVVYREGDSLVSAGPGRPAIFTIHTDGLVKVNLRGYALVPLEDYGKHGASVHRRAVELGLVSPMAAGKEKPPKAKPAGVKSGRKRK